MQTDIVKANALIEASYKPASLYQMRLLLAALCQVKAGEKLTYKQEFTVTAGGLAELTGNTLRTNYRKLARAADELMEMIVTVPYRPNGDDRKLIKRKINVVSHCDYVEGEGCIKLEFTHSIIPYISALSSHFTQYKAKYVMPMRSSYGIRLYELCLQWIGFGNEREFEVDEFKELLGLGDKYPRVAILKDRVIKPALADINKFSDLNVTFGQKKAGRRVTHFQFSITKKPAPAGKRVQQKRKRRPRSVAWQDEAVQADLLKAEGIRDKQ